MYCLQPSAPQCAESSTLMKYIRLEGSLPDHTASAVKQCSYIEIRITGKDRTLIKLLFIKSNEGVEKIQFIEAGLMKIMKT